MTDGQTDRRTDGTDDGQSDPYVSLCFEGDTKMEFSAWLHGLDWLAENHQYQAKKKKNMCVYCQMLKKIKVGRSEIIFF